MKNVTQHIQNRRSVRTFDGRELSKADERLSFEELFSDGPFDKTLSKENNSNIVFEQNDPGLKSDTEYIASYRLL